ncbi:MAG: hypothetical protein DMF14_12485 [Verrucomicrobia bacterium]|nr:MAG: hypothetical protein DMF14_12485 [Verrucomicrobiota bacterium]
MSLPRAKREHVPRSARAGLGVPISLIVRNQWRSNLAKEVEGTPACGLCAQRGFSPLFLQRSFSEVELRWAHRLSKSVFLQHGDPAAILESAHSNTAPLLHRHYLIESTSP